MEITIRLKHLLQSVGLDHRGITQEIAKDLDVHRHTIGKLYRNQLSHPSIEVLAKLCDWLIKKGVTEPLPQSLFGKRPEELWCALAAFGVATFYAGEYRAVNLESEPARRWIAVRDAEALSILVEKLTGPDAQAEGPLELQTTYIPSDHSEGPITEREAAFKEVVRDSKKVFKRIRSRGCASILLGSQRVNPLLEVVVADLFGAGAFKPVTGRQRLKVPFFMVSRTGGRFMQSCFGGAGGIPGRKGSFEPGTYWLDDNEKWVGFPWKRYEQDAGIVITDYDPGSEHILVALFGYSGWATAVLAKKLCAHAHEFWPGKAELGGRQVGVHICTFRSKPADPGARFADTDLDTVDVRLESMDPKVLKKYLR